MRRLVASYLALVFLVLGVRQPSRTGEGPPAVAKIPARKNVNIRKRF